MDQIELEVSKREVLGKKVRFLRRQRITPVNLFGHGIESLALQCDTASLRRVVVEARQTRLISLKVDSEKAPRTVMVRKVQKEPQTGETLHVDFYQVRMAEQVKVEIPIVLVGEAPALRIKENTLAQELNTLAIECLPAKIPNRVEVDIASLTESNQVLRVKDIKLEEGITVLDDPELMVARISSRPVEVEAVAEAAEAPSLPEEEAKAD